MENPRGPHGAAQDQEGRDMDRLINWTMSWNESVTGGGLPRRWHEDGSGPLAEENGRPAPREENSAGNGGRPLSGEDRGIIH